MRPLASRRCARFVVATTRSATPRSLAARRDENALRDPVWTGVARSHVPCGRSPAARRAGRRGGNGAVRRRAAAPAEDAGKDSARRLTLRGRRPKPPAPGSSRRPQRDGRSPPSAPSPSRRGTVPGENAPGGQIRGLRPHPSGSVSSASRRTSARPAGPEGPLRSDLPLTCSERGKAGHTAISLSKGSPSPKATSNLGLLRTEYGYSDEEGGSSRLRRSPRSWPSVLVGFRPPEL